MDIMALYVYHNTGILSDGWEVCPTCAGHRRLVIALAPGWPVSGSPIYTCHTCNGTGFIKRPLYGHTCSVAGWECCPWCGMGQYVTYENRRPFCCADAQAAYDSCGEGRKGS